MSRTWWAKQQISDPQLDQKQAQHNQHAKVILAPAFGTAAACARLGLALGAAQLGARRAHRPRGGSTEGLARPGPARCSGMSFWTLDNDQTVGYLRHAEIKPAASRWPASPATAQCLDVVKGEHTTLPYRGFVADARRSSGTTSR